MGLRDRALMAVMTYTFARVSAVVAMRVEDYLPGRQALVVRLHEKAASATKCRRIGEHAGFGERRAEEGVSPFSRMPATARLRTSGF